MSVKRVFRFFSFCLFLCLLGLPVGLIYYGIEDRPLVTGNKTLSVKDIQRAKHLLKNSDPRNLPAGTKKTVKIMEQDLNKLLQYALARLAPGDRLKVKAGLNRDGAQLAFTMKIPSTPVGSYINVSAVMAGTSKNLDIKELKIGTLSIPGRPVEICLELLSGRLKDLKQFDAVTDVRDAVKEIRFREEALFLVYHWEPELLEKIKARGRELAVSKEERLRLLVYNEQLVRISASAKGKTISLTEYLRPLFSLARKRSLSLGDPEGENRAAILSMALYVQGKGVGTIIGNMKGAPEPEKRKLTLRGRTDLPKHFMISAAITAVSDSALADLVGLFKELDDSRGGSGFSFADLAADRAGVRFSELAMGTNGKSSLMQQRMRHTKGELDFMPEIDRLPEGMMEMKFKGKYGDVNSDAYKRVQREIERRIDACGLYR